MKTNFYFRLILTIWLVGVLSLSVEIVTKHRHHRRQHHELRSSCASNRSHHETHKTPRQQIACGTTFENGRASHRHSPRITNGREAKRGQFPWQVALYLIRGENDRRFLCGGTIIDHWHIITANHCLEQCEERRLTDASELLVALGEHDRVVQGDGEIWVTVQEIIRHPRWQSCGQHPFDDIAILKVSTQITFQLTSSQRVANVNAICLPDRDIDLVDARVLVSGWGISEEGGQLKERLHWTDLVVDDDGEECESERGFDNDRDICAYKPTRPNNACSGDSGGPLMYIEDGVAYLVGVVSRQIITSGGDINCNGDEFPSGFTRITFYLSWIHRNTRQSK